MARPASNRARAVTTLSSVHCPHGLGRYVRFGLSFLTEFSISPTFNSNRILISIPVSLSHDRCMYWNITWNVGSFPLVASIRIPVCCTRVTLAQPCWALGWPNKSLGQTHHSSATRWLIGQCFMMTWGDLFLHPWAAPVGSCTDKICLFSVMR